MLENGGPLTLRPSATALVLLAIPLAPGVILGVLTWLYADGELAGTIILVAAVTIWLSVATINIRLDDRRLSKYVFGALRWSVSIDQARIYEGLGGDLPILPAIVVADKSSGRMIGWILKSQFLTRDIDLLCSRLGLRNAARDMAAK